MTSEDYNLKHNLFDDLAYDYPIIGKKQEWKKLESFINKTSEGSRTFLIIADFGCGKTLFLSKIKEYFKNNRFDDSKKSLIIPMRLIEGEPESKIGFSFVTRAFKRIGYLKMTQIVSKTSNLDETKVDSNFQKIITGLREQKRIAYDWLCGSSLSTRDKTSLNISKSLTTSTDALDVFFNFLKFLKHADIENVFLLIDEFEYVVTSYSQKQVDSLLYVFKDIYDKYGEAKGSLAKTIFIIAMTPGCWDSLTRMEEHRGGGSIIPWSDRVNPKINQIQLLPFTEAETEKLLRQRIKENRIKHHEKIPTETWPFVHPEFFKIIYERGKGIPRKTLKFCDFVFECGIEDNVEEFDVEYTTKILDRI